MVHEVTARKLVDNVSNVKGNFNCAAEGTEVVTIGDIFLPFSDKDATCSLW